MSVSKDMFGFIAIMAAGAAGYYLGTHPRYAKKLGTKLSDIIKTELNKVTPTTTEDVDTATINDPVELEEGVIDGTRAV